MKVHDPYNLVSQGYGSLQWNTNIQQLMHVGQRFEQNGKLFEVTEVSGVRNFSTGPAQRVHVKLVRGVNHAN